jgi:hypothetical protein
MKYRKYKSFTEIDRDIQIAKLERDIHCEKILLHTERLKNNFSPASLLKNIIGGKEKGSSSIWMNLLNLALPFLFKKFK